MLEHQNCEAETFSFSLHDPLDDEEYIQGVLHRDDLKVGHGLPIAEPLMDFVGQSVWHRSNKLNRQEPGSTSPGSHEKAHHIFPSMPYTRREVWDWLQQHDRSPERHGWTLIPLVKNGNWSLVVGEHRGPEFDV